MRRFILPMMAALLLLFLPTAQAQPDTPYDPGLMFRYQALTQQQAALFDTLYGAASALTEEVELPDGTLYDDVAVVMAALLADCPELIALDGRYSIGYYRDRPDEATSVTLQYTMDTRSAQAASEAMLAAARGLCDAASGDTLARETALYDGLCGGVTYQLDGAYAHSAYGALVLGQAACEGYAKAFMLLCRLSGIPCGMVDGVGWDGGQTQAHAWNIVYIDGAPALCDPTWDDQDGMGLITHWYFNLTGAQMAADHQADAAIPLPACTADALNWHASRGYLSPTDAEGMALLFMARLAALIETGEPVNLRYADDTSYRTAMASVEEWLDAFNAGQSAEDGFYGSYYTTKSDTQRCFVLMRR